MLVRKGGKECEEEQHTQKFDIMRIFLGTPSKEFFSRFWSQREICLEWAGFSWSLISIVGVGNLGGDAKERWQNIQSSPWLPYRFERRPPSLSHIDKFVFYILQLFFAPLVLSLVVLPHLFCIMYQREWRTPHACSSPSAHNSLHSQASWKLSFCHRGWRVCLPKHANALQGCVIRAVQRVWERIRTNEGCGRKGEAASEPEGKICRPHTSFLQKKNKNNKIVHKRLKFLFY